MDNYCYYSHLGSFFPRILCTKCVSKAKKNKGGLYLMSTQTTCGVMRSPASVNLVRTQALQLQGSLPRFSRPIVLYRLKFSGTYYTTCELWKGSQKRKFCEKMWHFALYDCTAWHESDVKGKSYECCLTPDINPYGYHSMWKIHSILFTLSSLCQIHLNLVCPALSRLLTQGREVLMLLITGACWDFMESCKPLNYCTLK